jgi:hypothetical protein
MSLARGLADRASEAVQQALLGLLLLPLDAEVLIDSYSASLTTPTEAEFAAVGKLSEIPHAARRVRGSANGLSQAMELVEQSDAVLASCVRHTGMTAAR